MKRENSSETIGLWLKTKYANLVRNSSSGIYSARFRHNGKLIWKGLSTDVLSTAAQRFPDTIKEVKDEQALLASGSDPRITFEAAARIYLERGRSSPDFKLKTKAYHWPSHRSTAITVFPASSVAPVRSGRSPYRDPYRGVSACQFSVGQWVRAPQR